jgi:hypothetical protein
MNRRLVVVAALAVLAAAGGCGIPGEAQPRPIEPPPGPYAGLTKPASPPIEQGAVPVHLVMTRDGTLTAVTRLGQGTPSLDGLMDGLFAGPSETEQARGITSALPGAGLVGEVGFRDGNAEVRLGAGLDGTGRSDVVLAIGQVVCTLDARPEVTGVVFTQDGAVVAVPRADGALQKGPLTSADYDCPPVD